MKEVKHPISECLHCGGPIQFIFGEWSHLPGYRQRCIAKTVATPNAELAKRYVGLSDVS